MHTQLGTCLETFVISVSNQSLTLRESQIAREYWNEQTSHCIHTIEQKNTTGQINLQVHVQTDKLARPCPAKEVATPKRNRHDEAGGNSIAHPVWVVLAWSSYVHYVIHQVLYLTVAFLFWMHPIVYFLNKLVIFFSISCVICFEDILRISKVQLF